MINWKSTDKEFENWFHGGGGTSFEHTLMTIEKTDRIKQQLYVAWKAARVMEKQVYRSAAQKVALKFLEGFKGLFFRLSMYLISISLGFSSLVQYIEKN